MHIMYVTYTSCLYTLICSGVNFQLNTLKNFLVFMYKNVKSRDPVPTFNLSFSKMYDVALCGSVPLTIH